MPGEARFPLTGPSPQWHDDDICIGGAAKLSRSASSRCQDIFPQPQHIHVWLRSVRGRNTLKPGRYVVALALHVSICVRRPFAWI